MRPGVYEGRILEHGTEVSQSGLPFVWLKVEALDHMGQPEEGTCRIFLKGGTEEKTDTAVRMARQALRACGFDPDFADVGDLDLDQNLLKNNRIAVKIKETPNAKGGFYENWDIVIPREKVSSNDAKGLTSALRAAKSKDEAPMDPPPQPPGTTPVPAGALPGGARTINAADIGRAPINQGPPDDSIPF